MLHHLFMGKCPAHFTKLVYGSHIKARFNIPHHANRAPVQRSGCSLPRGAPQILPTRAGRGWAGPHGAAGALLGQRADADRASPVLSARADAVTCSVSPPAPLPSTKAAGVAPPWVL